MYCFRCGNFMEVRQGGLYCTVEDMYVSKALERALLELKTCKTGNTRADSAPRAYGWYCPWCATPLTKASSDGRQFKCEGCGLELGRSESLPIIELHPHRK